MLVQSRQRDGEGTKRGDRTGPNPTDRAKSGVKRHVLTDARGVPVGVTITAANVRDKRMVGATLDTVPLASLTVSSLFQASTAIFAPGARSRFSTAGIESSGSVKMTVIGLSCVRRTRPFASPGVT